MKKPIVEPNELYTISQASEALGIDRRTLYRYTEAGSICCHRRQSDNRIVYYGKDITSCYYSVI